MVVSRRRRTAANQDCVIAAKAERRHEYSSRCNKERDLERLLWQPESRSESCGNRSQSHQPATKSMRPKAELTVLFGHGVKDDELGGWEVIVCVCEERDCNEEDECVQGSCVYLHLYKSEV